MKFTLNALKQYLIVDTNLDGIVDALTNIGLEVEGVIHEGERLKDFIVADITKAERHPDADRLQVCTVETGKETLSIVCGGKNARAGIKVALAKVGVTVPSFNEVLKLGKIRGVESQGMLCSSGELLIDYPCVEGGIIEVETDLPAGTPLATALKLDDPMIDISVTPNRSDCFSVRGVARDLVAYFNAQGIEATFNDVEILSLTGGFEHPFIIHNQAPEACYAFHTLLIKGVQNGESSVFLQNTLKSLDLRPISALVDVTNESCVNLGRPLHVFDADTIQGKITLRLSQKGEILEALDDKMYTLDEGMLVICDEKGIISLAGVMGGKRTAVTETTTNVLLESAWFNPVFIAKAGQSLNLISDARMRFERGVDPELVFPGLLRAAKMIQETCGGELSHPKCLESHKYIPCEVTLTFEKLASIVGEEISPEFVKSALTSLGCAIKECTNTAITVITPSWRHDLSLDVDLIEEVVRLRGVDKIKLTPLPLMPLQNSETNVAHALSFALTEYGYHEAVTFSFVNKATASMFKGTYSLIDLANPITEELTTLRSSILPSLLELARQNQNRGQETVNLFEIAPVYGKEFQHQQQSSLAALWWGKNHPAHWSDSAKDISIFEVKAHLMQVLGIFGIKESSLQSETIQNPSYYHPARAITYKQGNRVIAHLGQIHPKIMKHFDLGNTACAFEIMLDNLPPLKFKQSRTALSPYQPVERDFAFMVNKDFDAGKLVTLLQTKLVRQTTFPKGINLERVDLFDVYQAKDSEQKSLAVRLRFEPLDKTITDQEHETIMQTVTTFVEKETQGKLRQ